MGLFDDCPPAYFTANCDQRLKEAWLDEGGKLAQPESFALHPGYNDFQNIDCQNPYSANGHPRSRQPSSPHHQYADSISSHQPKNERYSTSHLQPTTLATAPFVHYRHDETEFHPSGVAEGRLRRSNHDSEPTVNGSRYEADPQASSGRYSLPNGMWNGGWTVDSEGRCQRIEKKYPEISAIKEEEEDVDQSLALGLTGRSRDAGAVGSIMSEIKDGRVAYDENQKEDFDQRYPAPSITILGSYPPARAAGRPPPSTFSESKQEWAINLLVFCSDEDEGLGRKDDEVLGYPTKTIGSTLFIFSEEWIRERINSTRSTSRDMEGVLQGGLKLYVSQVPATYEDNQTMVIRERITHTSPYQSSLREPTWIAERPTNARIDVGSVGPGPKLATERGRLHGKQPGYHTQPLPISPMGTPGSKVPPRFEWTSEYDSWQKEAGQKRDLERSGRMEGAHGQVIDLGRSEADNLNMSVEGGWKEVMHGSRSSQTAQMSNGTKSNKAPRDYRNGHNAIPPRPVSKPSKRIIQQLFGSTLGQSEMQSHYPSDRTPRVKLHRDPNAKSAVRKVKYMIQVQDGDGLRRIEVAIPDDMKKAMGIYD